MVAQANAMQGCIYQGQTGPITHYFCPSPSSERSQEAPRELTPPRIRTTTIARNLPRAIPGPQETPSYHSESLEGLASEIAKHHGVNPHLVKAMIAVESGGNARAVSAKGAEGVMQLMPETSRRFGVRNPFEPQQNIEGGVRYLAWLKTQFSNTRHVIAAYNAGEKAVWKYGGVPPYPETQQYVRKVLALCRNC